MVLFVALDAQQWPQRALMIGKEHAELALASKPRNSTRGYFNNLLARFRLEEMQRCLSGLPSLIGEQATGDSAGSRETTGRGSASRAELSVLCGMGPGGLHRCWLPEVGGVAYPGGRGSRPGVCQSWGPGSPLA